MDSNAVIIQKWWRKVKPNTLKNIKEELNISPIEIPQDLACINCGDDFFVFQGLCDECYYHKFITRKRKRFINDSIED